MNRPSHKEINNKIKAAIKAVKSRNIELINLDSIVADALELGYLVNEELPHILLKLLVNTNPGDYVGQRPPQKSYEIQIKGLELFAFSINCDYLNKQIYYKFALQDEIFYLVSLHEDR